MSIASHLPDCVCVYCERARNEGALIKVDFTDLLQLARQRSFSGKDSDQEIGNLLDRHARAFDSFDHAEALIVHHE